LLCNSRRKAIFIKIRVTSEKLEATSTLQLGNLKMTLHSMMMSSMRRVSSRQEKNKNNRKKRSRSFQLLRFYKILWGKVVGRKCDDDDDDVPYA
jgi:hypothetical protein